MLTDNVNYHDLGGDYFTKQDPERAMRASAAKPTPWA